MPKYIIEREIPDIGKSTAEQLQQGSKESNIVVKELGPDIQWVKSYVTDDKFYCVYIAPDTDILLEHARCVNVPANKISRIVTTTDPTTAEQN